MQAEELGDGAQESRVLEVELELELEMELGRGRRVGAGRRAEKCGVHIGLS